MWTHQSSALEKLDGGVDFPSVIGATKNYHGNTSITIETTTYQTQLLEEERGQSRKGVWSSISPGQYMEYSYVGGCLYKGNH